MLKNYFKIAWRTLMKNKVFSFINIFGLTIGLTSFLLIALYIFDELTFDSFQKNANNIYRIIENKTSPEGKETKNAVFGASVGSIVTLLSKDFIRLVLIAAAIAFPVAWWTMNQWLHNFAYGINIQWWMFALAGLVAIVIALATISFLAIKAAIANPVKSLRTE